MAGTGIKLAFLVSLGINLHQVIGSELGGHQPPSRT